MDLKRVPDELINVHMASKRLQGAGALTYNALREEMIKQKCGTYHLRPELKDLRPSTLFIWGDQDRYGAASLGEEMAKLAPRARCEVLRDAGHLPFLDQPERCNKLVTDFLKEG